MSIKKIYVFDFDKTLIHTAEPLEGRELWLKETGNQFPHPTGWWSKPESLDLKIFYPAINDYTYKKYYLKAIEEENAHIVLATGRLAKLKEEVQAVLDFHKLEFDEVHCNWGGETYRFKTRLFESIIRKTPTATEIVLYDDRHEHLVKFVEWAKDMEAKFKIIVTIIDVVNKKQLH